MNTSPEITLNPDVVCSILQDGGVLLDLETKQYFALNLTGVLVWQHLEDGGSLEALHRAVLSSAAIAPGLDTGLDAFATALVEHGLAIHAPESTPSTSQVPAPALSGAWVAPSVTPHGRPLSQVILSPFDPTVPIPE